MYVVNWYYKMEITEIRERKGTFHKGHRLHIKIAYFSIAFAIILLSLFRSIYTIAPTYPD